MSAVCASRRASLLLVALAAAGGCDRCGGGSGIAELVGAEGSVSADGAEEPIAFEPASVGRLFSVGEAVRTDDASSTAELDLAGGGHLHVDPESIVRFSRTDDRTRLDVEAGTTVVEAGDAEPLELETVFGVARIEASGRVRVRGGAAGRFEVMFGHAVIERDGESFHVDIGAAVDERGRLEAPPADDRGPAPAAASGTAPAMAEARAVEVESDDATIRAPGSDAFVPLATGTQDVADGAVLRSGAGTLAIPTDDGRVRVGPGSEVRVSSGAISLVRGSAEAEGGSATRLEVPGGVIVLVGAADASAARLAIDEAGAGTVAVLRGEARHEAGDEVQALHAPDTLRLGAGGAVEAVEAMAAGAPGDEDGLAAVSLRAGETIVVHDPGAPTLVRFEPAPGCGETSWHFSGTGHPPDASSSSPLTVTLRPGTVRYRARCADGTAASGSVRVDRDAGRTAPATTAPRTIVDADGRSYSVLYQSLLPEIVLRWPRAPAGQTYTIEIRRGSSTRTVRADRNSHTFASGELAEGTYACTFRASDGSASPPTTIRIRFDNTTPVATIRAPAVGEPLGSTAHVEGVAAEGATVTAGGVSVTVGASDRFVEDVPVPPGGCLSIRVAAPGRGIHHYVRCGASHE